MHGKKRLIVFLVLLAALALAGWLIWKRSPSADIPLASPRPVPADPRLTFPTTYRNVRPEVKYVGDETCASCHGSQTSGYHEHPMAHSMSLVSRAPPIERYDAAAHNPFEKFGFDFQIEHRGDHAFHKILRRDQSGREALALAHEARYAVGSGSHGRAYLFTLDNFVFRTPINWFSQGKRWDVAPYVAADSDNHYFQGVDPQCIYCHGNQAEPDANSLNRYRSPLADNMAIGCER